MKSALDTAVTFAKHGYYVFPLIPNGKIPYKGYKWKEQSTNDLSLIREIACNPRFNNCNWAIDCGKSNIFIVDIDNKKETDWKTIRKLQLPAQFQVKTPRGGFHLYFHGTGPNSVSKAIKGLDTRGKGGYAAIPGSINGNGKIYRISTQTVGLSELPKIPKNLLSVLQKSKENNPPTTESNIDLDLDHNVKAAQEWITNAPEAIEGSGGDQTTYAIACRLRDFGLSQNKTLELMLDWNDEKASPPWKPTELQTKISNAYKYARDSIGNATPDLMFTPIERKDNLPEKNNSPFIHINDIVNNIKPIEWQIKDILPTKSLYVTFGDPETYKSFLEISRGLSIAAGTPWYGHPVKQGSVFYICGEGKFGISRRIAAWLQHNNQKANSIPFFVSTTPTQLDDKKNVYNIAKAIEALSKTHGYPQLVLIDTLSRNMAGDENSTKDMANLISNIDSIFGNYFSRGFVHHTGHGAKERMRGSSVLTGASDCLFSVSRMDDGKMMVTNTKQKDAERAKSMLFDNIKVSLFGNPAGSLVLELIEEIDPKKKVRVVAEEKQLLELLSFEPNGLTEGGLYAVCKDVGVYKRKSNFSRAVRRLIACGDITIIGETLFFNRDC